MDQRTKRKFWINYSSILAKECKGKVEGMKVRGASRLRRDLRLEAKAFSFVQSSALSPMTY
jgi:hypothetical protein